MLIRYLPGKYDEKIPVPVQKKIISYKREEDNKAKFIFETTDGRPQQVKLEDCAPLMSGENKVRSWLKMGGLFALLVAFCAGSCNMLFRVYTEGYANSGVLVIVQLMISLALLVYLTWVFKVTIERYLYGGLIFGLGEIYFQSENEKTFFHDIINERGRKND